MEFAFAFENLTETARTVQRRIERDGRPDVAQILEESLSPVMRAEQAWDQSREFSAKIVALSEGLVGYTGRYTRKTTTPETVAEGVQESKKPMVDLRSNLRGFWKCHDLLDSLAAEATSPVFSEAVRHLQHRPNAFVENALISRAAWNQVEALAGTFRSLRLLDGLVDRLSMPIEFPERYQTINSAERTLELLGNHHAPNQGKDDSGSDDPTEAQDKAAADVDQVAARNDYDKRKSTPDHDDLDANEETKLESVDDTAPQASGDSGRESDSDPIDESANTPKAAVDPPPESFRFIRQGDGYFIEAFGESGQFSSRGAKGLHDIHRILQSAGEPVLMTELDESVLVQGDRQDATDQETIDDAEREMSRLAIEIKEAKSEAEKDESREQFDKLADYISSTTGVAGKPRNINDKELQKLRTRIRNRLAAIFGRKGRGTGQIKPGILSDEMPKTAKHFYDAVTVGDDSITFIYRPGGKPPEWETSPGLM
ncbi:MAG: hypothetical protein ACI8P0_005929 [Planctomycetaceae bacterium]|jgi:hypothetical protein